MYKKNLLSVLLICNSFCSLYAKSEDPIAVGNFALPTSQQPSPLFSFGQNIVDKGDKFTFTTLTSIKGKDQLFVGITPSFLYGLTDTFSLLFNLPVAIHYQQGGATSRGLSDLFIDAEYAFYQKWDATWAAQATIVGGIWFPTGSSTADPPTGAGTAGFFIGTTCSYMTFKWYCFTSLGSLFPANMRKSTVSPQVFYEAGLGMNLADTTDSIILGLLEFNGIYTVDNNNDGQQAAGRLGGKLFAPFVPGTILFLGPSLFYSNKRWVVQAGVQCPLLQSRSDQAKVSVRASIYVGYKF